MREAVRMNKATPGESLITEEGGRFRGGGSRGEGKSLREKAQGRAGRHVTEERNTEYITSVMSGGHEVLDLTGRAPRIDPSQVTDVKDHSFGR